VSVILNVVLGVFNSQSEVNQLHTTKIIIVDNHDVLRLQVPVDDIPVIMQVVQGRENTLYNHSTSLFTQVDSLGICLDCFTGKLHLHYVEVGVMLLG